jgi:hypothetical protein
VRCTAGRRSANKAHGDSKRSAGAAIFSGRPDFWPSGATPDFSTSIFLSILLSDKTKQRYRTIAAAIEQVKKAFA